MIFEELFTRGTALNQAVLWILLAILALATVLSIVDILRWCWFWWKGEDDEESEMEGDGLTFYDDADDPDFVAGDDGGACCAGADNGSGDRRTGTGF